MRSIDTDAQFVYNENGLWIQKTVNGVVTKYTLHGKNIVHMTQGGNELHFFYDAQNRPAVVYNGVPYAYVKSLQGDIVALLNGAGNVVVSYAYDAWGAPIGKSGSMAERLGTLNPFRYRGYVFDEETGLYYLRSRYYNAERCRFVNGDKQIGCGKNIIEKNINAYCNNNPVNFVDYNGREPGDAFSSPDEAAIDFAECYNALSISQNVEYASTIYKRTETKYLINILGWNIIPIGTIEYYTYLEPSSGTECETAEISYPDDPDCQLVGWIHSHGAYMREYENYKFSDDDYKVANWLFENEKAVYSYLATCSGDLWKYDITADEVTLVSSDIPFDENDPYIKNRKGK